MDPADQRHTEALEEPGQHLVGLDHEHLDERVGVGVVLRLGIDHVPVLIEDQVHPGSSRWIMPAFFRRSRMRRESVSISRSVEISSSV